MTSFNALLNIIDNRSRYSLAFLGITMENFFMENYKFGKKAGHTYTLSHVGEKSGILSEKNSQQSKKRIKNKQFRGTYQSSDKDSLVLRPIFHQFIECKWHRSYISIYCNFRFCRNYLFVQQNIPLILVTTSAGMTKNLIITTTIRPRKECRITIIGIY